MFFRTRVLAVPVLGLLFGVGTMSAASAQEASAQEGPTPSVLKVVPESLTLEVGATARLTATVEDADGNPIERTVVFYSRRRRSVGVNPAGVVEAYRPGEHVLIAMVPKDPENTSRRAEPLMTQEIPVKIPNPPVAEVDFVDIPDSLYAGTTIPINTRVVDTSGTKRRDVEVIFESSADELASFDEPGRLTIRGPGSLKLTARAESVTKSIDVVIEPDPVHTLNLTASSEGEIRTGDVVFFEAHAMDANGERVEDYPVLFATMSRPDPTVIAPGASAQIDAEGAFVAERPGVHTVVAVAGPHSAQHSLLVTPRKVRKEVVVVGQGPVRDRATSDLWVWQAPDGRDYAVTGTWGADGHAYFWDVTDPASIQLVDTVRVDARTVNDVKVSPDGKTCIISREGASNRKNGLVILDVSNPTDGVRVIARYDDQLNGGVHNVFIYEDHVYALSNGRRYDIINIEDPTNPYRVGRFELDTPGHGIHDVWVEEGIAYSSNWVDGVVAVDVGGGGQGGAPNNPVKLGSYAYPSGWNHAAFPYRSESTGKFLMFAGDEAFPYGTNDDPDGPPDRAAGWIHIIEWDDWNAPKEVARYQVPEAGTHNLWIENDVLYLAYYNGGLRVVDVSGELRGDLYRQGREIAFFHPYDPKGYKANAPFVWGPQPYKGHIFIADHTSGLWAVKLVEPEKALNLGEIQPD